MGINSVVVEVAAGLALVFFFVATIAAGVNQVISRWTDVRAKTLWQSLAKLLEPAPGAAGAAPGAQPAALPSGVDIGVITSMKMGVNVVDSRPTGQGTNVRVEELLATPSLRALDPVTEAGKPTKIDDIPPKVFAAALLELAKIKGSPDNASVEQKLLHLAAAYPDSPIGTFVASIAKGVGDDLDRYLDAVGSWFDGQMTRLSEVYKKNTRWALLIIGAVAAFTFNIDAVEIGTTLRDDSDLRAGVLTIADQITEEGVEHECTVPENDPDRELECARELLDTLNGLKLPVLGEWSVDTWKSSWDGRVLAHTVGLLLTMGAVSLGAPFWFDALRRLSGTRRSS